MKQFVLKKSGNEFDDESKKYTAMNDKLNELYEKLQGDVSQEEGDAIIEEFQNLIKNCGAAFELRVIPGFDSPVVTGESKAGALIFGITTNMKPDLITECFKACAQAFSKELERQINMEKMVPCAQCGRLHKYGEMYTSREVHTAYGFGFAVCRECYDGEMDRFLAEHPPFKEN